MQKITPFLWFDSQAEQAVNFYTSIFKKLQNWNYCPLWRGWRCCQRKVSRSGVAIEFQLEGQAFTALKHAYED